MNTGQFLYPMINWKVVISFDSRRHGRRRGTMHSGFHLDENRMSPGADAGLSRFQRSENIHRRRGRTAVPPTLGAADDTGRDVRSFEYGDGHLTDFAADADC